MPEWKLTPLQIEIGGEVIFALTELGADIDLLAILGSWGDTLEEEEILELLPRLSRPYLTRILFRLL